MTRGILSALILILAIAAADFAWAQTGAVRDQRPTAAERPNRPQARAAEPQPGDELLLGQNRNLANAGTIGVVTSRALAGTLTQVALDLSTLLDKGEHFSEMRVIPIISRGKMQNLWDVLYLRGVDIGFVQSDTLEFLKNEPGFAAVQGRLRYVASMFPEEVHLIARPEIRTIEDLAGKRVSVHVKGTGSAITMPLILRRLGINAITENIEPSIAMEMMRRGEIAAHTFVLGKPTQAAASFRGEGFHLLDIPYRRQLQDLYLPATFTNKDYPTLVPEGTTVQTVAVGNVMAVFNWPEGSERYQKVARFVEQFFNRFDELHGAGFHPKWKDVNLAASVPGWTRFKPAQDWLDRGQGRAAAQQPFDQRQRQ